MKTGRKRDGSTPVSVDIGRIHCVPTGLLLLAELLVAFVAEHVTNRKVTISFNAEESI